MKTENTKIDVNIQYKGEKYSFNTHKDDPLRRTFLDFCDRLKLSYGDITFTVGGRGRGRRERALVNETQTADDLELSDGDTIYAWQEDTSLVDVEIQYKGTKYRFKTLSDDPLRRMFLDFCDSRGLVYSTTRFAIDCRCRDRVQIKETQTADELGIAGGDTIYAAAAAAGEEQSSGRIDVYIWYHSKRYRFNTYRNVALRSIFRDFCHRVDRCYEDITFLFDGRRIPDHNKTLGGYLGLGDDDDDDDLIDAFDNLF